MALDAERLAAEQLRLDELRIEARWARAMMQPDTEMKWSREMWKWGFEIQRAYELQLALVCRAEQLAALDLKRRAYRSSEIGCRYGRKRRDATPETAPVADEPEPLVLEELPDNLFEQIRDWAKKSQKKSADSD